MKKIQYGVSDSFVNSYEISEQRKDYRGRTERYTRRIPIFSGGRHPITIFVTKSLFFTDLGKQQLQRQQLFSLGFRPSTGGEDLFSIPGGKTAGYQIPTIKRALDHYMKFRGNGVEQDNPKHPFPIDGHIELVTADIDDAVDGVTPWSGGADQSAKSHHRIRYWPGPLDITWVEGKDRNYLARLSREYESETLRVIQQTLERLATGIRENQLQSLDVTREITTACRDIKERYCAREEELTEEGRLPIFPTALPLGQKLSEFFLLLKENQSVTTLDLSHTNLGDAEAEILLETLRVNPRITEVNLDGNEISAKYIKKIAAILRPRAEAKAKREAGGDHRIPDDCLCPISHLIMIDPVIAFDGVTYEREEISKWLQDHDTSPVHHTSLESKQLIPNQAIKSRIEQFLQEYSVFRDGEELYRSAALTKQITEAIATENTDLLKRLFTKDIRLLVAPLIMADSFLDLACKKSVNMIRFAIKLLQEKIWENFAARGEAYYFQLATKHCGIAGATLIADLLDWQESTLQEQVTHGLETSDTQLMEVCFALIMQKHMSASTAGSSPLLQALLFTQLQQSHTLSQMQQIIGLQTELLAEANTLLKRSDSEQSDEFARKCQTLASLQAAFKPDSERRAAAQASTFTGISDMLSIFSARKGKGRVDMDPYSNEKILALLKHYIGDVPKARLIDQIEAYRIEEGVLQERRYGPELEKILRESIEAEALNTLIVPIRLTPKQWVGLHIYYRSDDRSNPQVSYINPLGQAMPEQVAAALKAIYPTLKREDVTASQIQLQHNRYNLGPYLVAILEALTVSSGQRQVAADFDIEDRRRQDKEALARRDEEEAAEAGAGAAAAAAGAGV